jgi:hypothetical protein
METQSNQGQQANNGNSKQMKVVWMIVERGDKAFWTRIGVGFENRDGSVTMQLDAFPVVPGARLQLRDYVPRDADEHEGPVGAGREPNRDRDTNGAGSSQGNGRRRDPRTDRRERESQVAT